jgi:hypothetical protein
MLIVINPVSLACTAGTITYEVGAKMVRAGRDASLIQFHARIDDRWAHVKIFPSRIAWTVSGVSRVSEMVPVTSISSVLASKSANSKWSLVVLTTGKSIEFLVDKHIAQKAARLVDELVVTARS